MSTQLRVDVSSPIPPFEQIRAGIAALISEGALAPGDRLPTVRALAADLDVAAGTVARAYRELEAGGLIESHGRRGTAVCSGAATVQQTGAAATARSTPDPAQRTAHDAPELSAPPAVLAAVDAMVVTAADHGISIDHLGTLVRRAYADLPAGEQSDQPATHRNPSR